LGKFDFIKIYLDDIIIFSKTFDDHFSNVLEILKLLINENMSINFEKCEFFKEKISYLGVKINGVGVKPDIARIKESNYILFLPKTLKEVQKLLGYINWYRPFIPNLSGRLLKFTESLKKGSKFVFNDDDKKELRKLFEDIKKETMLCYPNERDDYVIQTDASLTGYGGVLMQNKRLIGLKSGKFNETQMKYPPMERELLAIVKCLMYFKNIILGSKIVIVTDNKNLLYDSSINSSRAQRWKLLIQEYDYEIMYQPGRQNVGADMISRIFYIHTNKNNKKRPCIINDERFNEFFEKNQNENDCKTINVVNEENAARFITKIHNLLGHPGISCMYKTLNRFYKIKNLKNKINQIVTNCVKCQLNKHNHKKYGRIVGFAFSEVPFTTIASDVVGPFDSNDFKTENITKKFWILVISDICSRFTQCYMICDLKPETIIHNLKSWMKKFEIPVKIITDQGKYYTSKMFSDYLKINRIKHCKISTYNPTANGIVERINGG
jgi:hypothetical protein